MIDFRSLLRVRWRRGGQVGVWRRLEEERLVSGKEEESPRLREKRFSFQDFTAAACQCKLKLSVCQPAVDLSCCDIFPYSSEKDSLEWKLSKGGVLAALHYAAIH